MTSYPPITRLDDPRFNDALDAMAKYGDRFTRRLADAYGSARLLSAFADEISQYTNVLVEKSPQIG